MTNLNRPAIRPGKLTIADLQAEQELRLRRQRGVQPVADVLLAVFIGVLLTCAAVYWIQLEGITSAGPAAAFFVATQPSAWQRLCNRVRRAYLQTLLHWYEEEAGFIAADLEWNLPNELRVVRKACDRLRARISTLEAQA